MNENSEIRPPPSEPPSDPPPARHPPERAGGCLKAVGITILILFIGIFVLAGLVFATCSFRR
jgi:hypothetical protein